MEEQLKRKRGAPKGNHNAVKHGFYSRALNKNEQLEFDLAAGVQGFDEEIALLRFEIKKAVVTGDLVRLVPLSKAADSLEKLMRTRHKLFTKDDTLKNRLISVYYEILGPMGVSLVDGRWNATHRPV
jgi:hypothetical protein